MGRAWRVASLLLIAAHGNCNGNGAMGQRQWGNGATATAIAIAIAMALGQEQQEQLQWQWGKRNGAIAIDHVGVWGAVGRGRCGCSLFRLFRFFIRKS
jgi:hypothetical protein